MCISDVSAEPGRGAIQVLPLTADADEASVDVLMPEQSTTFSIP